MEQDLNQPLVSVIMPVFNAEKFLKEAIESILNQTYHNFEFLIFNDGSKDKSGEIIASFNDPRIKYFNSTENCGYVKHLNHAIEVSQGKYLARMDSDDVSMPERIEEQVTLMESDFQIGLCGTWFTEINNGHTFDIHHPSEHEEIKFKLLQDTAFGHPTIMIRKSILTANSLFYESSFVPAEDYKLWVDLSKVTKLANIPKSLLMYRVHDAQISSVKNKIQRENVQKIRRIQFEAIQGRELTRVEGELLLLLYNNENYTSIEKLKELKTWITEIKKDNLQNRSYPIKRFDEWIDQKLLAHILIRKGFNLKLLKSEFTTVLSSSISPLRKLSFVIKCLTSLKFANE